MLLSLKPTYEFLKQDNMKMTDEMIQQYAQAFWENGYLIIEDFFASAQMDHLNQVITQHFGMSPEFEHTTEFLQKAATEVIPWFPFREGNQDFQLIEQDTRLKALTDAILKAQWQNLYCMVMFSKQGTKGQAWHQDCPPENQKQFNLNRLIYTHDITHELGGETIILPKTHLKGAISVGQPDERFDNELVLTPKKGTLVLLHGHTWHRVLPIKGNYRVSVNSRAIPAGTPEDITDIAVYRNMRYKFSTNEVVEEYTYSS